MCRADHEECITNSNDGRCTQLVIHFVKGLEESSRDELPAHKVGAPPVAVLIGGEQMVAPFEESNDRIGCGSVFPLLDEIWNSVVGIIKIQRIAIGLDVG